MLVFFHKIKWPIIVLLMALTASSWIARKWTQVETNSDTSLLRGENTNNLLNLVLIDNLDKTQRTEKITEAAIFRHLLSEDTLNFITALEAKTESNDNGKLEMVEMLNILKSNLNKGDKITEIELYQIKIQPEEDESHEFIALKTTGTGGEHWWSLEKNMEHFIIQRSNGAKDDVVHNLEGNPRNSVTKIEQQFEGVCSFYDLFQYLLVYSAIGESYNLVDFHCQKPIDSLNKNIPDKSHANLYVYNVFEFSSWHPIVALIYMGDPYLVELASQHGDYDINSNYSQVTPLNWAILLSRTRMVDYLLNKMKADPNKCDQHGCPNQVAAVFGTKGFEIIELLLNTNKVGIDDQDVQWGNTALHTAAESSNVKMARYLLGKGANVNALNKERKTPLHYAIISGANADIVDLFLDIENVNVNARDEKGKTPLHYAISKMTSMKIVINLLEKGADPSMRDKTGSSCLVLAAIYGNNVELINLLLQTGKVTINDRDEETYTVLHWAARKSNVLMARHLMEKRADPSALAYYNETPLHLAARFGKNTEIIDVFLNNENVDIETRDIDGGTPLHHAISGLNVETARHLLNKGADPNARDSYDVPLLFFAAIKLENVELTDLLIQTGKVNVNEQSKQGFTILHVAMNQSQPLIVRHLIEKGADPSALTKSGLLTPLHCAAIYGKNAEIIDVLLNTKKVDIEQRNIFGMTPLYYAIEKSNVLMARHLLVHGANPKVRTDQSLLELVAMRGKDVELIDLLLETGKVNVEDRDQNGRTALHWAAQYSNVLMARHLIEKGADPNTRNDGKNGTPLHVAAHSGENTEILDVFLNHEEVDIEARDINGFSPLHCAIFDSNVLTARHLLDNGADPNARANNDISPLGLAAMLGKDVELIDLLLETGEVHVYDQNKDGYTAIHWAASKTNVLMARHLMEKGADPNALTDQDETPLHYAALMGENTDIIEVFLNTKKVDIEARDIFGMTPLRYAVLKSNILTARYLIEKGANPKAINDVNETVLHAAAKYATTSDIFDLCLQYFDVDELTADKETPLHLAATTSNVFAIRYLIEKGADPNARDHYGITPLFKAAMCAKDIQIMELLLNSQANL